jgi:hypothetical protein
MTSSLTRATIALSITAIAAFSAAQQMQVQVDGKNVTFPDVEPQKINSVVMVPIRSVCEEMGATVIWDQGDRRVTTSLNGTDAVLNIGNSETTINGSTKYLEAPPTIVGDRTLVPMSFFSDTFGAEVSWNDTDNLVAVNTTPATNAPETATNPTPLQITLAQNEVLPVSLDIPLSSMSSQVGDNFTATVSTNGADQIGGMPNGTKIEGHVAAVQTMTETSPAILDLAFDRVDLSNGTSIPIDACLLSLDTQYVAQRDDGTYQAQGSGESYKKMVYVGYGSPTGQLVGVQAGQPLAGSVLEDEMGNISAQIPADQKDLNDIELPAGAVLGVRINQPAYMTPPL